MVKWEPRYSLGLDEIDEQHKWLFEIINKIWQAIVDRADYLQIIVLITELEVYAQEHFSAEEALMAETGYPGMAQHKEAHLRFIERVAAEKAAAEKSRQLSLDLVHFLKDWLTHHILTTDRSYTDFTRKNRNESLLGRFFKRFG